MEPCENKIKASVSIVDYISFFAIQLMPRLIVALLLYKICKEVIKYEYYMYFAIVIISILQYKFSFIIYTVYVINCEDEEKIGDHEILYLLSEMSRHKYSCICRYKKSFVVKSILSERYVYFVADGIGNEILDGNYRTLLHPNMQSEHEEFYNILLQIHNKKYMK